ncbi:RagB/SusD family nutrient uptake outer membrane protein [Chondrinema litorale]|uniref:RagB/SusD family nutrient uptake outer membrane protein n=1 Tax=Chondrinema litorale TaxID=2994555 RepID=UPI002542DF2A|nr:RagB/SusD family nutrient uptake outer membrane protein [Chondrinema litorale]UZR97699.1 RagB/SusD family nutrient uptake outer membrane protein [Chondrinema litorale]
MKSLKIIYTFLLILAFTFSSCNEETVELDPIGDTEAGFFLNEEQMTQAVLGIYQKVSFFYTFRSNNWLAGIWALPGDDLTTEGTQGYERFVNINGGDGRLTSFYTYAYQLIARSNIVIQKIDEADEDVYSRMPELKPIHRGEALFLRAWMYFKLWNTYGSAAPLVTERITELEDAYPPSSQGTELLDQAIIDLEEAATLLPSEWDASNLGRVTSNSALGLRGKILVFRGSVNNNQSDFTAAIANFNAISGLSLMPNYRDNFDAAQENNGESLFEYQANDQSQVSNPFLDNDAFAVVGDLTAYYGMYTQTPSWVGTNIMFATESLINAYEEGDPRLDYTLDLDAGVTNVIKYTLDGTSSSGFAGSYNINLNNPRILRYADILLLKAEAIVRTGESTSEAIALINEIRQRARFSTEDGIEAAVPADLDISETDTETILEWIFAEKRIELACEEGHRWYDLRRRYMMGEIDLTTWDFNSARDDFEFKDENLVFPIPNTEVANNPNLVQNPGY